jgi:hypothetical protein
MPGINTNPSFFSKLMGQMPGMTNSLAQNYGDPSMQDTVRGASSVLGMKRNQSPQGPQVNSGILGNKMPGQNMGIPSMPPPVQGSPGIETGPSPMMMSMPMGQGAGGMMGSRNSGNTGFGGGMNSGMPTDFGGLFGRLQKMYQGGPTSGGYSF